MDTLYNSIKSLCDENGVRPGKMCVDLSISKSMMTKLKNGSKQSIQVETAQKIADYFGVSVDRVLGVGQKENPTDKNGEVDEDTMELIEFAKTADEDERKAALGFVRLIKKQRVK